MIIRGEDGCGSAAVAMFDEIEATGVLKPGGNYTGLESKDAYIIGFTGELRFEGILNEWGCRYEVMRRTDGHADFLDYLVYWNGIALRLDVKTAGEPWHLQCMMPEAQYQKRRQAKLLPHIVVAARLEHERKNVSYHGWSSRREVAGWFVGYPKGRDTLTRMRPFLNMNTIESLAEKLDKVQ